LTSVEDFRLVTLRSLRRNREDSHSYIGRVDLDVATRVARRSRRRWLAAAGVCVFVFALANTRIDLLQDSANRLAATGVRVPGVVVHVDNPSKSTQQIDVRFAVGGTERVRKIGTTANAGAYRTGDQVTVIYDRADPEQIRTDREPNLPGLPMAAGYIPMLVSLGFLPFAALGLIRWWRRVHALRRSPWRSGWASAQREERSRLRLRVRFHGGGELTVITATPVPAEPFHFANRKDLRVWIGGDGNALTVLLGDGPFVVAA
jgi:hypothetical protein